MKKESYIRILPDVIDNDSRSGLPRIIVSLL